MRIRYYLARYLPTAFVTVAACQPQQREHQLREFVAVQTIESVEAHNYSGHHWLTAAELKDFKSRFGAMRYGPGGSGQVKSVDMGITVFVLHSRGRTYQLVGRPNSQYIGVPNNLVILNQDKLSAEDQVTGGLLLFKFSRPTNINNYYKGRTIAK